MVSSNPRQVFQKKLPWTASKPAFPTISSYDWQPALSWMSPYNCSKAEIIKPALLSHQVAAQVTNRAQQKEKLPVRNDMASALKKALTEDEWFRNHSNVCSIQDGLAWVGTKLHVPKSQRLQIMNTCHDSKAAGHFRFVKTLHLIKRQFWWPSLQKDIESPVCIC